MIVIVDKELPKEWNEIEKLRKEYHSKLKSVVHEYAEKMLKIGIKIESIDMEPRFIYSSYHGSKELLVTIEEDINFA